MAFRVDGSSALANTQSAAQDDGYTVRRGDTLSSIAQAHGVSLRELIAANPQIKNPDRIYPGQQITIREAGQVANDTPVQAATQANRGKGSERASAPIANGGLSAATLEAQFKSAQPMLRNGSRGPAVSNLQSRLKELGFDPGPIDGIFGPRTEAAVRAFQRNQGIEVDGIVGPQTRGKLANPSSGTAPTDNGTHPAGNGTAEKFVQRALDQEGDRYVYGAETNLDDPNPDTFDCSELVQWAAHQAGGYMPDGSSAQKEYCRQHGTLISVEEALHTRGALLFKSGHVAISLGDGEHTIEAMGRAYGVVQSTDRGRFTSGGLIPGLEY